MGKDRWETHLHDALYLLEHTPASAVKAALLDQDYRLDGRGPIDSVLTAGIDYIVAAISGTPDTTEQVSELDRLLVELTRSRLNAAATQGMLLVAAALQQADEPGDIDQLEATIASRWDQLTALPDKQPAPVAVANHTLRYAANHARRTLGFDEQLPPQQDSYVHDSWTQTHLLLCATVSWRAAAIAHQALAEKLPRSLVIGMLEAWKPD